MAIESFKFARHALVLVVTNTTSTIGSTMVGTGKNFQNRASWKVGKHYFQIGFCKYSIS